VEKDEYTFLVFLVFRKNSYKCEKQELAKTRLLEFSRCVRTRSWTEAS
jgi:hypothetical protein